MSKSNAAFGMGPGPGMMSGGTKTSLSPPGVGGVNKGGSGVGLSSAGFGGESGPSGGMPGMMKGKQSSTFGSSSPPGFGAGGGMTKNSNPNMSEGPGDKDGLKMPPPKFGGSPSPGFGGGFGSGGGLPNDQKMSKSNAAFGMGPGPGIIQNSNTTVFFAGDESGMPFTQTREFIAGGDRFSDLNTPLKGSVDRKKPGGLAGPGSVISTASKVFRSRTEPRQFGSASINSQMLAAFRPGSGFPKQSMSSFRDGDTPYPSPLFGISDEILDQTGESPDSMRGDETS